MFCVPLDFLSHIQLRNKPQYLLLTTNPVHCLHGQFHPSHQVPSLNLGGLLSQNISVKAQLRLIFLSSPTPEMVLRLMAPQSFLYLASSPIPRSYKALRRITMPPILQFYIHLHPGLNFFLLWQKKKKDHCFRLHLLCFLLQALFSISLTLSYYNELWKMGHLCLLCCSQIYVVVSLIEKRFYTFRKEVGCQINFMN